MSGNLSTDGTTIFIDDEPVTFPAGDNRTAKQKIDATAAAYPLIVSRAQAALTNNATFLAIASPTAAQVATQTKALTRQVNALIRYTQRLFGDASDT